MTEGSLSPAFGIVNYHSANGTHAATICTKEWSATPLIPLNKGGSYTNWLGFPCDGQAMWEELLGLLAPFNPASTVYDTVTLYTKADEVSPAIPRATWSPSIAGTNATPGWTKATQRAWIFRDEDWNVAKLYQLDTSTDDNWDATVGDGGIPAAAAVAGSFTSTAWAWSSRKNKRPQTLTRVTIKLNDELRHQYGMD